MSVAAHAIVAVVVVRCVLFVSAVVVFAAVVAVLAVVVGCRWFARSAVPSLPCLSLECLDVVFYLSCFAAAVGGLLAVVVE